MMSYYTAAQRNGELWAQPLPQHVAPFKPFISRATCDIEVPSPRNGRPGYRWVQGWVVNYAPGRISLPMRRAEALNVLREELDRYAPLP